MSLLDSLFTPWSKYWAICVHSFIRQLEYRTELMIWLILDCLPTVILFLVWKAVYQGASSIRGFTFDQMVQYYFYTLILLTITSAHFERRWVTEIRDGKIDRFLTRPLSFLANVWWQYFGSKIFYALLLIPVFSFLVLVSQPWLGVHLLAPTFSAVLSAIIVFAYAFTFQFFLGLFIVLAGFWLEYAEGLEHFKWITVGLLSGSMMPRAFMPSWLQFLVNNTPFQYLYAVPIEIMQGMRALNWTDLGILNGCLLVLILITSFIWQRARYQYTSAGG